MKTFKLETYGEEFTEVEILFIIQDLLDKEREPDFVKLVFIELISYLKSEDKLTDYLNFCFDLELIDNFEPIERKINYSGIQDTKIIQKIRAIYYSEVMNFKYYRDIAISHKIRIPDLHITRKKLEIFSNMDEIKKIFRKKFNLKLADAVTKVPTEKGIKAIDIYIAELNRLEYEFESKEFKSEKKLFKELRKSLPLSTLSDITKSIAPPGRPKNTLKRSVDYLVNYENYAAEKYIRELKNLLLTNSFFQNSPSPKKFNYLLFALHELGDINLNLGEIENIFNVLKQDLSKDYLKARKHKGSIQNFRNQKNKAKEIILLKKIKSLIIDLKEENVIIRKSKLS